MQNRVELHGNLFATSQSDKLVFVQTPVMKLAIRTFDGVVLRRSTPRDQFQHYKPTGLPVRNPSPLTTPEALNQSWSVDFMHDALICGCRFRTFNVVDDFNREALSIDIDLNLPAQRVVRVLDRRHTRGIP